MKQFFSSLRFAPVLAGIFKMWIHSMRFSATPNMVEILDRNTRGESFVIALWHDELFSIAGYGCVNTSGLMGIVSPSKDGEFVASIMESLGQVTVRGSSSRGGMRALLQAKHVMDKEKKMAVFAVDGPRGPRHTPKDGAIFLAQRAGVQIVPIRAYPSRKMVFEKAWDKFQLPYPFTRCQLVFGEPYSVTTEKLTEDILIMEREKMTQKLNGLKGE